MPHYRSDIGLSPLDPSVSRRSHPNSMASITQMPYRRPSRQGSRQASIDTRDEIQVRVDHYIGIDVGTGSARACIIDSKGDIVGLASENIGLWQPQQGYYVRIGAQAFSCLVTIVRVCVASD